jgi:arylsulfatase A-like enzyme/Tfp pilus assembly protein PilF
MQRSLQTGAAWAGVIASVLVLGCCKSSKGPAQPRRLNLVLVTIDTLRADRLGCYGYSGIETPNLDRIARQGALFENAITHTPLTAPSHASIFTGLYPAAHGVRDTGGFVLQASHVTLAEIMRRQGWDTAAFVGASVLKRQFGFNQGFGVYGDEMPKPDPRKIAGDYAERRAEVVVDKAIAWLGGQSRRPFFLWVHVFDPHSPYDPPPPFREKYAGRPYDGEVAYTDRELGRLFAAVAGKSPEDTLIAVMSDHGESLSDHGEYTHGVFLYDSTVRIAFLLAGPGVPKSMRVKQQARTVDVLPTVLELMGIQTPAGVQGASLTPAFRGKPLSTSDAYLETLYPKINMDWAELRGIRASRWKYIRAPKAELYDLQQDPGETDNVIGNHPTEAHRLEAALQAVAAQAEKVQTTMADPRTLAQLKSLGYLGGSSAQQFTLTGGGIDPKDRLDVLKSLYLAVSPDASSPAAQRVPLLRKALADDPGNATVYYHLGNEYARTGRAREAMKLYQDALRHGLSNAWLFSRLAYLFLQQGNKDEAIAYFEKAAQRNPSDNESLNDLGMAYLETGRLADAERALRWSAKADDQYALAYNGLGLVAIQKHDLQAARESFEKAVQLDADLLEAQLNLGRIYQIMGAHTRARACFETFLAKASPKEYGAIIPKVRAELAAMK